jgi:hypothetical protein
MLADSVNSELAARRAAFSHFLATSIALRESVCLVDRHILNRQRCETWLAKRVRLCRMLRFFGELRPFAIKNSSTKSSTFRLRFGKSSLV